MGGRGGMGGSLNTWMYISLYTDMYPVAWHFHMETHFASLAERQYHKKAQNLIIAFDLDGLQKLLWVDYYGSYPQLHQKALPNWTNNEPLNKHDFDTYNIKLGKEALRKKCPNTEFFLVWIQENMDQKKIRIRTLHTVKGKRNLKLPL